MRVRARATVDPIPIPIPIPIPAPIPIPIQVRESFTKFGTEALPGDMQPTDTGDMQPMYTGDMQPTDPAAAADATGAFASEAFVSGVRGSGTGVRGETGKLGTGVGGYPLPYPYPYP